MPKSAFLKKLQEIFMIFYFVDAVFCKIFLYKYKVQSNILHQNNIFCHNMTTWAKKKKVF